MPLPDHDAVLGADVVTSLDLNYRWRPYVISALELFLEQGLRNASEAELDDILPKINAMITDLYDP